MYFTKAVFPKNNSLAEPLKFLQPFIINSLLDKDDNDDDDNNESLFYRYFNINYLSHIETMKGW